MGRAGKRLSNIGMIEEVLRIAEEYRDDRGRAEDCGVLRDGQGRAEQNRDDRGSAEDS